MSRVNGHDVATTMTVGLPPDPATSDVSDVAPKRKRRPSKPLPTPDIAAALSSSFSVKAAAVKLRMTAFGLERRCREQGLIALYEACAQRGIDRRGRKKRPADPPMPTWSCGLSRRQEAGRLRSGRGGSWR